MTSEPAGGRIVPAETALTAAYWAAARRGVVLLQRCADCAIVVHPPEPVCPGGTMHELRWFEASGQGRLVSFTSVEHAVHPAVRGRLPYLVALVELDEGPRLICNLAANQPGCDAPAGPGPGARVALRLGQAAGGLDLPVAYLAPGPDASRHTR
ncbi:MAG TPA: OB-fold domain-containing protein [Streptosporangiaceae bacterium]|nr:OB-fold domain-containing protein [Streptosporangiaceae bacterium]